MRCVRLRVRAFGQWSLMPEAGERAASAKELKCPKYVRDCGLRVLHVSFSALGPKSLCLFAEQSPLSPWPVPEPSGLMHSLAQVTLCTSSL